MKKGRFLLYILIHSSIHHSYRLSFAPLPFFLFNKFFRSKIFILLFSKKIFFLLCISSKIGKPIYEFLSLLFHFIFMYFLSLLSDDIICYAPLLLLLSFLFVNIHLFYLQSMYRLSYSCKIYPFYFYFFFKSMKNIERGQEKKEENQIKNIMIKCDMKRNEKDEGENVPWNNNNL